MRGFIYILVVYTFQHIPNIKDSGKLTSPFLRILLLYVLNILDSTLFKEILS